MSVVIKSFVDIISSKKVAVFSKTYCPYCTNAKNALQLFNLSPNVYEVVELDTRNDGEAIQDYLKEITGGR